MANIREIQSRINSVKDTMKITNAMYMISSSKLTHAKKKLADTEPYFYALQGEISRILRHQEETGGYRAVLLRAPGRDLPYPPASSESEAQLFRQKGAHPAGPAEDRIYRGDGGQRSGRRVQSQHRKA